MKERHQIAVRTLVDYVLRAGDLDMRFVVPGRPLDGIRIHQKIQRGRPAGYHPEVPVFIEVETKKLILMIGGRIDGVLKQEDAVIIEEIKSTTKELKEIELSTDPCHWGQAKAYAYMYAKAHSLEAVTIRLTYSHLDTGDMLELNQHLSMEELESFFADLIDRYLKWAMILSHWRTLRNDTIDSLDFPFRSYRSGQRAMAVTVYRTVRDSSQALIQAATGIGKTMAALYPTIKTFVKGYTDRIFFLTARNTGKQSAAKALDILQVNGLRFKRVSLTAKDTICFCPDATCNPDQCEYAKGHFDRLPAAMDDAFLQDNMDRLAIEAVATQHRVCPFEFSLELSRWADCIICDYNYAFDPRVYLKRFFDEENGAYTFLVDEAHNMVDRSREMFSAQLTKGAFLELRRVVKPYLSSIYRAAGKINTWMHNARKMAVEAGGFRVDTRLPADLEPLLRTFLRTSERWLAKNQPASYRETLMALYFDVSGFLKVWDQYNGSYVTYSKVNGKELVIKLFCLNPSDHLRLSLRRARASVFFSATMTPASYFQNILGCDDSATKLDVPSPFPRYNLKVMIAGGISTYYVQRDETVDQIVGMICTFVRQKEGNYLCYFPSYAYMAMVHERFEKREEDIETLVQEQGMDDTGRTQFLNQFSDQREETLVGFAVMGGIFGEGIDLAGERLSGAVIVGVGLPAICPERDLIRDYFDEQEAGFDFAYRYPGINRVLQAAGRVIRTDQDCGALLLVDQRFRNSAYRILLPPHWSTTLTHSEYQLEYQLKRFWSLSDGGQLANVDG